MRYFYNIAYILTAYEQFQSTSTTTSRSNLGILVQYNRISMGVSLYKQ